MKKENLTPAVRQFFSPSFIRDALAGFRGRYRERQLGIEVFAIVFLNLVLLTLDSLLGVVDQLKLGVVAGLRPIHVSKSAFYKRLHAIQHEVFLELLRRTTGELAQKRKRARVWIDALAPFAAGIYAIDDTTLDALMRRTKALKEHTKGATATLGGRLGCALDLRTGLYAEVLYDRDAAANEKNHIRPLIERLGAGNLFVFDLGYFSFPFFDYLTEHYCYFVTRFRNKTSFKVVSELADGPLYRDRIIYLGKHRADRAASPVRLVELFVDGSWHAYMTNMLNPQILPAPNVWALYRERWTIEKSFAAVKRSLEMAFLHPCHENGMLMQIWSTLCVYQVLQDLRLEIATRNGWDEDEVSWTNLMRRIALYAEKPELAVFHGLSLRDALVTRANDLILKKRGVRKRRRDKLPEEVLAACRAGNREPDYTKLRIRTARQSRPEPLTSIDGLVIGGLS